MGENSQFYAAANFILIFFVLEVYLMHWESDRRFWTPGFFHESVSPRPPSIQLEPFGIFSKIRGDIRELMFITVVNDTDDKLLSGVNDTGENTGD